MYYTFFGLTQPPFKITPDTDFFFEGGNRGAVLEALIYAISQGEGIIKVTGEVGAGKTMLCRVLQARLPKSVETVYLANPSVSPEEILHAIAFELQLPIARGSSRLVVMHALNEYLLRRHAEGRQVVVFVEESQSMPIPTLEEIRLLSNLETKQHKLLQIVLFGQPELDDNLRRADIRQLRERITHSFSLSPLNADEVRAYLAFRLKAAGYIGQDLFNRSAVAYLTHSTGGLTRRINIVADKALLAAFAENTHSITRKHLRAAVHDSEFSGPSRYRQSRHWLYPAAAVLCALAIGLFIYLHEHGLSTDGQQQPELAPPKTSAAQDSSQFLHDPTTKSDEPNNASPAITESRPSQPLRHSEISRTTAPSSSTPASRPEQIEPLKLSATLSTTNDLLEQRLLATDRWLADSGVTTYSIQLLGSNDPVLLKRYFETLGKFIEIERVFVYRTVANQQPSMTVLYGAFNTRPEAVKSLEALPGELKINRPYIRTVQGIRTEIGLKKPS